MFWTPFEHLLDTFMDGQLFGYLVGYPAFECKMVVDNYLDTSLESFWTIIWMTVSFNGCVSYRGIGIR